MFNTRYFSDKNEDLRTKLTKKSIDQAKNSGNNEGKKNKREKYETDRVILTRRQKQIDYGKNTIGYTNYRSKVPIDERKKTDPSTPDRCLKYSRRGWDTLIKLWRIKLHQYDDISNDVSEDVMECDVLEDDAFEDLEEDYVEDLEGDYVLNLNENDEELQDYTVEDLQENYLAEDLQEDYVAEELQENYVAEDLQEDYVAEDLQEDYVAEDLQEDYVAEDLQENVASEDFILNNIVSKNFLSHQPVSKKFDSVSITVMKNEPEFSSPIAQFCTIKKEIISDDEDNEVIRIKMEPDESNHQEYKNPQIFNINIKKEPDLNSVNTKEKLSRNHQEYKNPQIFNINIKKEPDSNCMNAKQNLSSDCIKTEHNLNHINIKTEPNPSCRNIKKEPNDLRNNSSHQNNENIKPKNDEIPNQNKSRKHEILYEKNKFQPLTDQKPQKRTRHPRIEFNIDEPPKKLHKKIKLKQPTSSDSFIKKYSKNCDTISSADDFINQFL